MPAPNTPVAKPFFDTSYHAELKGIPTANTVPAIPRQKETISSMGSEFI